ncbi:hypothetical protein TNCV_3965461 [Trichonephila clavipes]|nr:hypothetical protein TNCV_3965461 [Trichonephila clavipes]
MQKNDICHYAHEAIEPQLPLNSDPSSFQALEGQPWSRSTMHRRLHKRFMRGDRPFESHSCPSIGGKVCSEHVNMSTGSVINGGLSLLMGLGLASKAIVGVY